MLSLFEGQIIAITGAASGIGRATAKLLATQGALLSLSDVNKVNLEAVKDEVLEIVAARKNAAIQPPSGPETLPSTQAEYASTVFTFVLDVRSQAACDAWVHDTVAYFGGRQIAGAANLAGITNPPGKTEPVAARSVADAELDIVWDVNVRGIINSMRAELPYLQEGLKGCGGASIVNAGSISGLMGLPGYLPYVSSKHAVIGITRTAAKDEGTKAIRVNAVAPGMIDTPLLQAVAQSRGSNPSPEMFGSSAGPTPALARLGEAEEVAEVIMFLLSSKSSYINGAVIPVDGGLLI